MSYCYCFNCIVSYCLLFRISYCSLLTSVLAVVDACLGLFSHKPFLPQHLVLISVSLYNELIISVFAINFFACKSTSALHVFSSHIHSYLIRADERSKTFVQFLNKLFSVSTVSGGIEVFSSKVMQWYVYLIIWYLKV